MKLAVSHDKEVRLGWANVVARPVVSARSSAPATSMPNMRATPPSVVLPLAGLLKVQRFLSTSKDAKSRLPEQMLPSTLQIGRAHDELQSLMRISYAVFC